MNTHFECSQFAFRTDFSCGGVPSLVNVDFSSRFSLGKVIEGRITFDFGSTYLINELCFEGLALSEKGKEPFCYTISTSDG